jgi:hypothetical protein
MKNKGTVEFVILKKAYKVKNCKKLFVGQRIVHKIPHKNSLEI